MSMKRIIKTFSYDVENCQVSFMGEIMTLRVQLDIIEKEHRFLWWKWKTYDFQSYVPYLDNDSYFDYYDYEVETNRRLKYVYLRMKAEANKFITELKCNELLQRNC